MNKNEILEEIVNRIVLLELEQKAKKFHVDVKNIDERVTHIENIDIEKRLVKLEKNFVVLKNDFEHKLEIDYKKWCEYFSEVYPQKKPHKCPVCDGYGNILSAAAKIAFDEMLRANLPTSKVCNPCEGKGIVWG